MSWSYWSTNETHWSGTWTPRKKSKLLTEQSRFKPFPLGKLFLSPQLTCRGGNVVQIRGARKGERSERGPWHEASVAPTALAASADTHTHTHKTCDVVMFVVHRAEAEDEHLERTLEQNKGKMAKKEEKCVLQ